MTANPIRAIGYVRVSKAREEMISPELQANAISDYCQRNRAALVSVIQDLDSTGRNFARAGIQSVIEQVEAGDANLVIVWKWSRFGRNVRDCLVNIDRLEAAGGRLVAATEDFDDTPVGRFGRGQFLLMAQFESERIGEQWKEAHARRFRNGLPYNGHPRFGYTYAKDKGYEPDPLNAPILVEIYDRYIGGESPNKIADDLNARSIGAPRGGQWWSTTVQQVMETGFAAGLLRYNTRTGPQRKMAEPQFAEGKHEPVITRDTWERYLRRRQLTAKKGAHVITPAHPFSGLVTCGTCGGSMYRMSDEGRIGCSATRQHRTCERRAFTRLFRVEDAVRAWLAHVADEINYRSVVAQEAREGRSDARKQATALTRDISKTEASLVKLTKAYAEGIIPIETYITTRDQLLTDRQSKSDRLAALADDIEVLATPPNKIAPNLLAEWDDLDDLGKRDILAALIARIEVHPRGKGYAPEIVIVPRWGKATHT